MLWFMGNQRAQAQFDRAKWRLVVLLPVWVLQLGITTVMIGLFAWRLGDTMRSYKDQDDKGDEPVIEVVWEATNVALSFVASVCTFVEMAKFFGEALTPWTMLFTHVVKLTCSLAILSLDVVVYVQRHDRHYSLVGLGLDCAFIFLSLVLVIYAIRVYRRLSVYDDYAHPVNVKPFGFNDDLERDTSYQGSVGIRGSIDKHFSSASSRLSIGSSKHDMAEVPMRTLERTPSVYSHKRDTQFDDYVARRSSVHSTVSRVASAEFTWTGSPIDLQESGGLASPVSGRPRGTSNPRAPSYASDRGLVAVPEEDGDDNDEAGHTTDREAERRKAREALLGGDTPRDSISTLDGPVVTQEVDDERRGRR